MSLRVYRDKRRFQRTPEPRGGGRAGGKGRLYLIHKHAARRLHYDLRLELHGALKSWAVPKGPSLDPKVKRLAVHVEDHPVEYANFEGTIPKGEYGAGKVEIWDKGRWLAIGDPDNDYRHGKLRFVLEGEKLRGGFELVRMGGQAGDNGKNWLLIKRKDSGTEAVVSPPAGARRARMPRTASFELATPVTAPPEGEEWIHEIKFDGYRAICRIKDGKAAFITRSGKDWSKRFDGLTRSAGSLPVTEAMLDGEVVVLRPDGTTSFQDLQQAMKARGARDLVYFAFDLLHLDGHDLTALPLEVRKQALKRLLARPGVPPAIRYSDHQTAKGRAIFEQACRHRLEGIVSKRLGEPYRAGRGRDWLKVKCLQRQEFVIGGFTEPEGSRHGFGALLLGVYEKNGKLRYCGRVGTGFSSRTLTDLSARLGPLERKRSPFSVPPEGREARGVHWVNPMLGAEVEFIEWTRDGLLRQPAFLGVREDKDVHEIVRERAIDLAEPGQTTNFSITHPDKILYPDPGLTKEDLARYYTSIADRMLPYITGRPLMLLRCPEGYDKQCFYQKHAAPGISKAIRRSGNHMLIDSPQGLIGLVQMGVLEIHVWGASAKNIERPDRMVFDLDPDEAVAWRTTMAIARSLRERLEALGLEGFVQTTGGKGLHVVVPLAGRNDWPMVRDFSHSLARGLARDAGDTVTAKMSKAGRRGKIFIDYLRNVRGATAVAPYSTRARKGAPVATPVSWTELKSGLRPDKFTLKNLPSRLAKLRKDPWQDYESSRATITAAMLRKVKSLAP